MVGGVGGAVPQRRFLMPCLALATAFLMFEVNGGMVEEMVVAGWW